MELAFSPDDHTLAAGARDMMLWDLRARKERARFPLGGRLSYLKVAYNSRGKLQAAGASDWRTVKVVEVAADQGAPTIIEHPNVMCVSLSPNGKILATAGADKTARLWEVGSGGKMAHYRLYGQATCLAFSPDGLLLAVVYKDAQGSLKEGIIGLVNISTGKQFATLKGHTGPVWSMTFSPDGHTLASASVDETVKLWDVPDPRKTGRHRVMAPQRVAADRKCRTATACQGVDGKCHTPNGRARLSLAVLSSHGLRHSPDARAEGQAQRQWRSARAAVVKTTSIQ
jgi:WD40 repeat protein